MTDTPRQLHRDIIKLSGPDTLGLLQGLFTSNILATADNSINASAFLTPQGKILETFFLWRIAGDVFIDIFSGRGAGFAKKMMLYRLRAAVTIEDISATYHIGIGIAPDGALLCAHDPRLSALGQRWLAPAPGPTAPYDDALRAVEIAHGVPAFGHDYGEADTFPLDVNLDALGAIDHKKGCFVGQEVASRMFRKGAIRKRSWGVHGAYLTVGADILQNGKVVGQISSVQDQAGIAKVRLDRLTPDAECLSKDVPVTLKEPDYLL